MNSFFCLMEKANDFSIRLRWSWTIGIECDGTQTFILKKWSKTIDEVCNAIMNDESDQTFIEIYDLCIVYKNNYCM